MIYVPPTFILIIYALPILAGPLAVLALFPAFPRSRFIAIAWTISLVLVLAMWAYSNFISPHVLMAWKPPRWYHAIIAAAYIIVPFGASYLLRRERRNNPYGITGGLSALIVLFICVISWAAMNTFQRTCVFYDLYHDAGQAWCPQSWQAVL